MQASPAATAPGVLLLGCLVLLTGCVASPSAPAAGPADGLDPEARPVALQVLTGRILASPPGHRMHEFQLAVDPRDPYHLLMGAVDLDDPNMGSACIIMSSTDGGKSWERIAPTRKPWIWQFDPWVAIDEEGRIHLTCIELTTQPYAHQALLYVRSDDGGKTWAKWKEIRNAQGAGSFDKIALGLGREGRVFLCGVSAGNYFIALSKDGGDTWTPATNIEGVTGNCNGAAQGLHGEMYATHNGRAPSHNGSMLGVVFSRDGGDNWSVPGGAGPSAGAHVSLSVDPRNGDLVLGAPNGRLYRSQDAGATYVELRVGIPDEHRCSGCRLQMATSHVDAAGRIGHLWMRVLGEAPRETREIWFTVSADGGLTWAQPVLLATEAFPSGHAPLNFVPRPDPVGAALGLVEAVRQLDHPQDAADHAASLASLEYAAVQHARGDYWGMTSTPEGFLPMWIDHTDRTGISQVWTRLVQAVPAAETAP